MDFNPYLKPWVAPSPEAAAGKGSIENPADAENIVWQTRAAPPTAYENRLADALERVFDESVEDLETLVERLNELGLRTSDGRPWTPERFEAEMAILGY